MKMKKPLLSRKAKTLIYISIVLLSLAAIIAGNFPLTPRSAFRLAEKGHLLEAARIIGTESIVSAGQKSVIIAKSDECCMTYAYKHFAFHDSDYLAFKRKTGDLTFLSIQTQNSYDGSDDEYFTIILFDEYPQAVRAKLFLTPYMYYYDNGTKTHYKRSFIVTATRESEEYFIFRMDTAGDLEAFLKTASLMTNLRRSLNDSFTATNPVPGKIQLYDKDGNMILEREIDLQNPSK